jgi:translation initiation factor 1
MANDIYDDLLADLDRAETVLTIRVERRRYNKPVTIVEGFPENADLKAIAKNLKKRVGAGGTVEDGHIEIQGEHSDRLPEMLEEEGFTVE